MSQKSIDEIEILIRARYPVIYVVSWEEGRIEDAISQIAKRREKKIFTWSIARGIQQYSNLGENIRKPDNATTDPAAALDHVLYSMDNAIFIFRDLHPFLESATCNASIIRHILKTAIKH
jgi:hypothetical protein